MTTTAGTLATTAGTTAATTAGTIAGGTSVGSSGMTGTAGAAGSGNSANCPVTAPMDGDVCTILATQCTYGNSQCSCEMQNGAMQWNCGFNFMMQECPTTQPAAGGTCTGGRGNCTFGTQTCDCVRGSDTWACWDPADCPATMPANDTACPTVGMECPYGGGRRGGCQCEDTGWNCGRARNDNDAGM